MKRAQTKWIVVHCAATPPALNVGVKEIREWHLKRGFKDIGYHFVIRRDGTVERGRPEDEVGAHVEGMNGISVGICLVGGVNEAMKAENNFTEAQFQSLEGMINALKKRYPAASVRGHRDFLGVRKDCPSFDVAAWMKERGIS
jgi:N-acetyl-anhydromuramyl-L-alanine amidase AmpD